MRPLQFTLHEHTSILDTKSDRLHLDMIPSNEFIRQSAIVSGVQMDYNT